MRLSGVRRKGLEQRLVKALSTSTDINVTTDIEHTELVEPTKFSGTITSFISDKEEVVKEPKRYMDDLNELSL